MKRYLMTGFTAVLASLSIASVASASQALLNTLEADLNGDGVVTLTELKIYNRAQRQS
ncbi:MAG: hypothetical protein IGR92_14750 [Leptolyngbyaceae cyanobacterium T60_A2020_046]|nr:hypothetical protein [Leptolyngbyaceae cyanobacterium T60_A2020_046]